VSSKTHARNRRAGGGLAVLGFAMALTAWLLGGAFGVVFPGCMAALQKATDTLATTLDALSCAGVNMCNRNQAEVPRPLVQEKPQERTYVEAINIYAAQFGGEQLALPPAPTT
jgi:hypothetical protein